MQKKYLLPFIIFLIGMILTIIGSLFKIMHWPGASIMLVIGMLSEAAALIILIVTILKNK